MLIYDYFLQVMTMVTVFIICWGPYATLSMIGVLGFSKVHNLTKNISMTRGAWPHKKLPDDFNHRPHETTLLQINRNFVTWSISDKELHLSTRMQIWTRKVSACQSRWQARILYSKSLIFFFCLCHSCVRLSFHYNWCGLFVFLVFVPVVCCGGVASKGS